MSYHTWLDRLLSRRIRGIGRLRTLLRGGHSVTLVQVASIDGIFLGLDPEGYIDRFIIDVGYYERDVLDLVMEYLPDNGVFWDVGSNIGLHALTAKKLRPAATVVAFEPAPTTTARLMQNVACNALDVTVVCAALGDAEGYSTMRVKTVGNSGLSSLRPWDGVTYDAAFCCRVERGDSLILSGTVMPPNVMKIDVEGFEERVLRGMGEWLDSQDLQAIIFESDGAYLDDITNLLTRAGFHVAPIRQANAAESSHRSPNYLAKRK